MHGHATEKKSEAQIEMGFMAVNSLHKMNVSSWNDKAKKYFEGNIYQLLQWMKFVELF